MKHTSARRIRESQNNSLKKPTQKSQFRDLHAALRMENIDEFSKIPVLAIDLTKTVAHTTQSENNANQVVNLTLLELAQQAKDPAFCNHIFSQISSFYHAELHNHRSNYFFSVHQQLMKLLFLALDCNQPIKTVKSYEVQLPTLLILNEFRTRVKNILATSFFTNDDQKKLAALMLDVIDGKAKISSIESHYTLIKDTCQWTTPQTRLLILFKQLKVYITASHMSNKAENQPTVSASTTEATAKQKPQVLQKSLDLPATQDAHAQESNIHRLAEAIQTGNLKMLARTNIHPNDLLHHFHVPYTSLTGTTKYYIASFLELALDMKQQEILDVIYAKLSAQMNKVSLFHSSKAPHQQLFQIALACQQPDSALKTYLKFARPTFALNSLKHDIQIIIESNALISADQKLFAQELLNVNTPDQLENVMNDYRLFYTSNTWEFAGNRLYDIASQMRQLFRISQDEVLSARSTASP